MTDKQDIAHSQTGLQDEIQVAFESEMSKRSQHISFDADGSASFNLSPEEFSHAHEAGTELGCIDEGVTCGPDVAGSYILLGLDTAVDALKDRVESGEITCITSHAGCGAAGIYCKQNGIETENPDEEGIAFSQKLAARLSEETGKDVTHRHIEAEEMSRPAAYHDATVIYLSAETFDPHLIDAASGFVINPHYHPNKDYTKAELEVAAGIATGDHGFGSLLTKENPLIIAPIGSADMPADELQAFAEDVFAENDVVRVATGITPIQSS